jgi:hypothetical protein
MVSLSRQLGEHISKSHHICVHCQRLTIDPENSSKPVGRSYNAKISYNSFAFTVAEIFQASRDACPIFKQLVKSIDYSVNSELDITGNRPRNALIDLQLWSIIKPEKTPDLSSVKILCR